ncbi:putative ABC transporter permease subunit [Desnuesiella massiliensis]|uniref:putative ABC transporter permease subunit n=1 Tax=Desnuesiella massiliensis TaxID=1650662 RepID=UPI0006E4115C|nr:hypothetical protein [Desnuesiella massiliensis]
MSKIISLVKVFLKNGGESLGGKKGKKFAGFAMIIFLAAIFILSLGVPLGLFISEAYDMLAMMQQQGVILGFGMVMVSLVVFVFGILYVLTTFYFAKDIESLLPLPLKSHEILTGKFIAVLVYEYLTELVVLAPIIIVYGAKSSAGALYYIYSIIVFLLLPVLPLVVAAIINMVIMRFTNLGKHKDAFRVVGGLLAMFSGIGINIMMQRVGRNMTNEQELMKLLSSGDNSLIGIVSNMFPSSKFSAFALASSDLGKASLNLLIFLAITAAAFIIFMIVGNILYFKGVIGMSESFARRKKLGEQELDKSTVQNSAIKTYILKELRVLFRTPAYLINCVIINFLWPIFFLIPLLAERDLLPKILSFSSKIYNNDTAGIVICIAFAIMIFISSSNSITSTAISREGQNIFVSKYIPMRYRDQIFAKVMAGFLISIASATLFILLLSIVTKAPIMMALVLFIVSALAILFTSLLGIIVDLRKPKLNWDDENKAVKQNFNSFIAMMLCMAIAGGTVYLTIKFKPTLWMAFGVIALVGVLLNSILVYFVSTKGEKMYKRIQ